jgi:L-malate glycosyltransferase
MRVLYVERTGLVGGGERSLLGLLDSLPDDVAAHLACPAGPLPEAAARAGVATTPIAECVGSLKLHPLHTPVALGAMAVAGARLSAVVRRRRPDLLHANSIRAGMIAAPVARLLGRPLVVHVRDRLPPSRVSHAVQAGLAARADAVIAISEHVARGFDPGGRARRLRVIDNPFDLCRLDPRRVEAAAVRRGLGLPDRAPVLALVGQITPWKGQAEAVRALAAVRATHPDAMLLVVGEAKFTSRATRYDNRAYLEGLRRLVGELDLGNAVRFLGERPDVPEILGAADLALVPSWDEPFGRTVVEAMAMRVPVLATAVGGPAEVVHDGVDGRLLAPRRPDAWAEAIRQMLDDEPARRAMAAAGRASVVARFGGRRHADAIVALYRTVLAARAGARRVT